MENAISLTTILFFASIVLWSCKKSKETAPYITPVTGKWMLDSGQFANYDSNGGFIYVTFFKSTTAYYDFRTDGKVYTSTDGGKDTVKYTFGAGANYVRYIQYNFAQADTIITLTSSQMVLNRVVGIPSRLYFHK